MSDPSQMTRMEANQDSLLRSAGNGADQTAYLSASGIQGTGGYVSQPSQYISGMEAGSNLIAQWENNFKNNVSFAEGQGAMMAAGGPVTYPGQRGAGIPQMPNGVGVSHLAQPGQSGYAGGGPVDAPVVPAGMAAAALATGALPGSVSDNQTVAPPAGFTPGQSMAPAPAPTPTPTPAPAFTQAPAAAPAPAPAAARPGILSRIGHGIVSGVEHVGSDLGSALAHTSVGVLAHGVRRAVGFMTAQPAFEHGLEAYAQVLNSQELNDAGVPNRAQGVPGASSTYDVTGQSGTPHSLPGDYWQQTDAIINKVTALGAAAGHNPLEVQQMLQQSRLSSIQGHVMKWLSAASEASLNNKPDELIQALRNANYYLPNGQNLNITKDASGHVEFQDPIYPYVDSKGDPLTYKATPDAKPNMIPANQEYIQMVGTALLNPMAMQGAIMGTRIAGAKMQQEQLTAQGAYLTGQGQLARGQGISKEGDANAKKAQAQLERVPSQNYLDMALADRARVQGASQRLISTLLASSRVNPQVQGNVSATLKLLDGAVTGTPMATDPNSAAAGKVVPNSASVPKGLQNISSTDYARLQATASSLAATGMPAGQSMNLALEWYQLQSMTHPARQDTSAFAKARKGGTVPNAIIDPRGSLWLWQSAAHRWAQYPMLPQGASMLSGGSAKMQQLLLQALIAGQQPGGSMPPQGSAGSSPSALSADMNPYSDQ